GAGYAHDRLERRRDLDAAQRAVEPRNGDSHLAFIAGGLRPCVTHPNRADEPVCFVDLDGVNGGRPRRRQTRVIGFHREAMAEETRQALANPRAVPGKALGYARYDLVRVLNTGLSTLGLRGSLLERILAATLAVPAARVFRVRRSISLLVAETDHGRPAPVEGVYQSPILIQWRRAARDVRELDVTLYRLE